MNAIVFQTNCGVPPNPITTQGTLTPNADDHTHIIEAMRQHALERAAAGCKDEADKLDQLADRYEAA